MLNLGENLSDEEVIEMIRAADAEDHSKVNYLGIKQHSTLYLSLSRSLFP